MRLSRPAAGHDAGTGAVQQRRVIAMISASNFVALRYMSRCSTLACENSEKTSPRNA